jgi:hypothetical protein
MSLFKKLDISTLRDILLDFQIHYTKMVTEGSKADEFEDCKFTIQLLQSELDYRKHIQREI